MQANVNHRLSLDTQATLLLCGHLDKEYQSALKPLSTSEYTQLTKWLIREGLRPADLLESSGIARLRQASVGSPDASRIEHLLQRGSLLALQVETWTNQGLWIIGRSDDAYPARWKEKLKHNSPPILYGAGDPQLLQSGGLAIVGSRDVDNDGLEFARRLAEYCVKSDATVISGGARGVDQTSMLGALAVDGNAVGVLADSLIKASVSSQYRQYLRAGTLALVSPFSPHAGFSVGNAMSRNKLVYTLAEWAVVVDSTAQKGGTWAGATENLKEKWVPLFVRIADGVSEGNRKLVLKGAFELAPVALHHPRKPLADFLADIMNNQRTSQPAVAAPSLFDVVPGNIVSSDNKVGGELSAKVLADSQAKLDADSFWQDLIWPCIMRLASTKGTLSRTLVAETLGVRTKQSEDWLNRAVEEGKLVRQTRPISYALPHNDQLPLLTE